MTTCPGCGLEIRGHRFGVPAPYEPPLFCRGCGVPYPWAPREAVVLRIENLLEEEPDLSDADRAVLTGQLVALRQASGSAKSKSAQTAALHALRDGAPKAWELAKPLVAAVVTSEVKRKLNLP